MRVSPQSTNSEPRRMPPAVSLLLLALISVLMGLAVTGCGGSSSGSHPESQAAYTSDMVKVCEKANSLDFSSTSFSTPADIATNGPKVVAGLNGVIGSLERIVPPSHDSAKFDDLVAKTKAIDSWMVKLSDAAKSGNAAALQRLASEGATISADSQAINSDAEETTGRSSCS